MTSGYSGTPLAQKLGIKAGDRVLLEGAPAHYRALVAPLPDGVRFVKQAANSIEMIHFFTKSSAELKKRLPGYRQLIAEHGMIWVSWPKKTAKIPTDVTEDVVRAHALAAGLVDVKVCAVDEVWSGLKLVIRLQDRGKKIASPAGK